MIHNIDWGADSLVVRTMVLKPIGVYANWFKNPRDACFPQYLILMRVGEKKISAPLTPLQG